MNIVTWIILGLIAGWLASMVSKGSGGIIMDIVLGIIGAFVGGFVMNLFGASGVTGFNLYSVLVAFIGAVILIAIGRAFSGNKSNNSQ
ncbi:MAG: GlsB/YeaQ/YmgE family stress response membrane protein [Patescibacteria group bacterium]